MKAHIEKARASIGDLGALADKTEAAERRILSAAKERLDAVQADIESLRPGLEAAADSQQDRYLELIEERGKLNTVIARAEKALA